MLRTSLLFAVAAAGAIAPASAQTTLSGSRLIGFTSGGVTPVIQRQTLCGSSARVCPTGVAAPAAAWAGGATYDAIDGGLWHTQGTRMAKIRTSDCALLCSTPAFLTLGNGSVATGLAMCESRLELYQLESIPGTAAMHVRHARSCPLNVLSSCRIPLPTPRHIAGAITVDELNGLFYYAASVFGPATTVVPQNVILVARASNPCNIICRFNVPTCGNARLGPITGMTYDHCSGLLHVTDGGQTTTLSRSAIASCNWVEVRCCAPSPSAGTWHGIDIEPVRARPVGRSCLNNACRQCPNLALTTRGDASIGNPFFAFDVSGAPAGGIAALAIGPSPCLLPGIAAVCGRWHVNNPVFLPSMPLAGTTPGGCDGAASWALPIPKIPALCQVGLCVQAFILCPPPSPVGGPGAGLTNALEVRFSG